jgi:hypothetical protein
VEHPLTEDQYLLSRLETPAGLCATCVHRELKASARSVFLRCQLADADPRFLRYPPLPVLECAGWQRER